MTQTFFNPGDIRDWVEAIRFDLSSPAGFASSFAQWLTDAPVGAAVAGGLILVAVAALSRKPGMAALIVLLAAAGAIAFGTVR